MLILWKGREIGYSMLKKQKIKTSFIASSFTDDFFLLSTGTSLAMKNTLQIYIFKDYDNII